MNDVLKRIGQIGIIPVIVISDVNKAVPLATALMAGGINCAEVTFRTAEAEECIRHIAEHVPEILLGAGTVTKTEQVERAVAAGAKFIVTPGFNPKVVSCCVDKKALIIPGCSTPSDMEAAMEFGLDTVKFFPAEQSGGLAYIKACSAPYPGLRFVPTGGINAGNLGKYAAFPKIAACGGSWMVSKELIEAGDYDEITKLCREAAEIVSAARK